MQAGPQSLALVLQRIEAARPPGSPLVAVVAASKQQAAASIRRLAAAGCRRFGENYVQEGRRKMDELAELGLEWHLLGPLQSNKCREAALAFDWIQSVDRSRLVALLDQARPPALPPLQVLVQVNIDGEARKAGCLPEACAELCAAVGGASRLALRGLMAIPAPSDDPEQRADSFRRMRALFLRTRERFPRMDTLSMGMSDDFELAIAEGATMVRLGTVLFGARAPRAATSPAPLRLE